MYREFQAPVHQLSDKNLRADSFQKNVLILSRDVKPDIINKALEKKNITVFYHEDDREYMIYKSKKYTIDLPVWDINQFADLFIG